jgi:hypothetical protein
MKTTTNSARENLMKTIATRAASLLACCCAILLSCAPAARAQTAAWRAFEWELIPKSPVVHALPGERTRDRVISFEQEQNGKESQ